MRKRNLAGVALASALVAVPGGGAQASGHGGAAGDSVFFVAMDEIAVPIIDADRVNGALRLKLVLDAGNAEAAAEATAALPMLRAASVAAALEFARLNASALRAVDAEQLDHDVTAAIKAADPDIQRVLIVEVAADQA